MLWLDLFTPHGPWDPPQPFRDQYVTVEPDEFEAGEEGDLVEEEPDDDDDEIEIDDVAALIDVPGRRGGRRAQRGRAVSPAPDLRRQRDARRPLPGRAVRGHAPARTHGRHARDLHQRSRRAAGRARICPPVPALALRRADSYSLDHPDAARPVRRHPAPGPRSDGRPLADHRLGPGSTHRSCEQRHPCTATTCSH